MHGARTYFAVSPADGTAGASGAGTGHADFARGHGRQ